MNSKFSEMWSIGRFPKASYQKVEFQARCLRLRPKGQLFKANSSPSWQSCHFLSTNSHLNSEARQHWARAILGLDTAWETPCAADMSLVKVAASRWVDTSNPFTLEVVQLRCLPQSSTTCGAQNVLRFSFALGHSYQIQAELQEHFQTRMPF